MPTIKTAGNLTMTGSPLQMLPKASLCCWDLCRVMKKKKGGEVGKGGQERNLFSQTQMKQSLE